MFATKRGKALEAANWPLSRVLSLSIAAFAIVIASFVVLAQWGGAPPRSDYTPAHMEDGKFVPGTNK
ncbi:hypothetical protein D3C83_286590 [compost metagenome]